MKKILGLFTLTVLTLVSCKKQDETREGVERLNTQNSIELLSKTIRNPKNNNIDVVITAKVYDNGTVIQNDTIKISQITDKPIYFTIVEEMGKEVIDNPADSVKIIK